MKDSDSRRPVAGAAHQSPSLAARWRRSARWRTPLIALLALVVLLFAAVDTWGVDVRELIGYLIACVVVIAITIGLAFIFSLLLRWLRRDR